MQKNSAFRKLSGQETDGTNLELAQMGCAPEMMNVINAQHILIAKLLHRQDLLHKELTKRSTSSGSCSGSGDNFGIREQLARFGDFTQHDGSLDGSPLDGNGSPLDGSGSEVKNHVNIIQGERHLLLNTPRKKVFAEYSSSNVCSDDQNESVDVKPCIRKRQTQTKNMVKNFAKAIFGFIRKNREKRVRILNYLGISDEQFMKMVNNLKGEVHSISELRALWLPETNVSHQAFRMLSEEYLRKHCFERTFNSRVQNHSIHLKYRYRLLEGLKNPQDFTSLKTN